MNKIIALLFNLLSAGILLADNPHKNEESKIEKVTVFLDGAQVTRSAKTSVATGRTDIILSGLSPYLDNSSITVSATGGVTVVSVTQEVNHLNEQKKREDLTRIVKRKEEYTHQLEEQNSMKSVYDEEVEMLGKNQLVNSQHTDLKAADLKAALDFHEERLTQLNKTLLTYTRTIKKLNDTIAGIDKQLAEMNAKQDVATSDITVSVKANQPTQTTFTITYFVNNAGWYPTYDLRVEDISKPINIAYRANVHQSTGEEWKEVKLTLSNGEPKVSGVRPEIKPWYLSNATAYANTGYKEYDGRQPNPNVREVHGRVYDENNEAIAFANILVRGTSIGTTTDEKGNYSLQLPSGPNYIVCTYVGYERQEIPVYANFINIRMTASNATLESVEIVTKKKNTVYAPKFGSYNQGLVGNSAPVYNVETTETYAPTTFAYEIELPYTIPNDGKNYVVDIKQQNIDANYQYIAVPRLDKTAYLTAAIPGWNDYNLLSGEANLYFEGTYIGKTVLNTASDNDTLEISLGADKGITVSRTKLKDFSKKSFLSDKISASRAFDINIRNNKKQAVHILVEDQFPLSSQKEIEVDKQEYTDAKLDEATGQLTWTLDVPAVTEKKVGFKYAVKYPKTYHIQLE